MVYWAANPRRYIRIEENMELCQNQQLAVTGDLLILLTSLIIDIFDILTNNWQLLAHIWLRCKKRAARDASSPLLGKFDAALFCVPTSCVQWQLYVAVHSVKWTLCSGSSSSSLHWQEVYHMQYAMCKLHLWLTSCEHVTGSSRTHFSCIQAPELLGPSPLCVPWICQPIPKSSWFLSLWHHG